ncbi:nucleoside diphosphate kinase [Moorella thermoacetica]|uniref:Nucleoside diphosphate kinase n=1 Tax=Moorella thermoacetica (strain ATCC 39073 / JCM 9320) TaxID=264732 RepID=NDK_MOOTA|nr:nucleoside-diphosphate kinase [Moorella thermoacetica]Q2RM94.1 RecName: Full=Nucleoside diphosphate kinase; Short=NDK; Short=NDP kinase; AltName: Full=Nucleoside-2-P kinase [Moorella thermoacetica ATCC 39073]AKX92935.1 nucleoside diphosphate kinase [Moorella thermoacetica]AKX95488.1 nucleoside diphosphate kinase [Moorella thermoacetica]APC07295.1 nucleoside diphosphate kinase [Moorella thermoacetica]OIQ56944.1 nucleoside diphosphate kinase [Moorella thermoacetica]OIQ62249.1 nucleoside diph
MAVERTFSMIKPEGVRRGLVGAILARLEQKGYRIVALKMLRLTPEMAAAHYAEHRDKPFYQDLINHITSGPVVAMVLEGPGVIAGLRRLMGATNPQEAAPGTIRGDFALETSDNVIHGADSPASAEREIALYFTPAELG